MERIVKMQSLKEQSPLGIYIEHCMKGELAYQVCTDDNAPVFFPRAVAPGTGRPVTTPWYATDIGSVSAAWAAETPSGTGKFGQRGHLIGPA